MKEVTSGSVPEDSAEADTQETDIPVNNGVPGEAPQRAVPGHETSKDIFAEPIIQSALEIFGGRIVPDNGKR